MTINMSTPGVEIARYAGAMYGLVLDDSTVVSVENAVSSSSLNNVVNGVYAADFSTVANSTVATTVATNLGLTGTLLTQAQAYILAQLNAAPAGSQGATIMTILNMFGQMTSDPTWGTAATAWETKVSAAVTYGQNGNNTTNSQMSSMSTAPSGGIFTLTTGVDTLVGNATGNNTFNATDATSASNPNGIATFGSLDSVTGKGANNVFNVVYSNNSINQVVAATVTGVQTANLVSDNGITENTSTWTGLTALNATTAFGGQTLVAAATTNVTSTATGGTTAIDGGLGVTVTNVGGTVTIGHTTGPSGAISVTESAMGGSSNSIAVDGGTTVSVVATGNTGGAITIGANTPPTGTITVANTVSSIITYNAAGVITNLNQGGNITVTGGTVDKITQTTSNAVGTTSVEGNVIVTGGTSTTSVVVNQAQATAQAVQAAIAGVVAVTGVTAAPGVTGVTAATGVSQVAAQAGVVGAAAGGVFIADANAGSGLPNTITSVTLNNYGISAIVDDALSTLSLTGVGGTLGITNINANNSTLNLTANGLTDTTGTGSAGLITDVNNHTTTLNVTTTGANSNLAGFKDSSLTKLTVSGTNVLTLGVNSTNNANLATVTVSGAAGFNDGNGNSSVGGLATLGATLTSFTTTSSGTITAALNDTNQTFVGSTGQDIITISDLADATKAITGGSATNNELILDGGGFALSSATAAKVTGFETLGVTSTVTGTVNLSDIGPGIKALDVIGSLGVIFTNVAQDSSVAVDASTIGTLVVNYKDGLGLTDVVGLTLGTSSTAAGITVNALSLQDVNGVGVGTVNLVSNDTGFNNANTITTLNDNGLLNLNVSGTGGLAIGTLTENTTAAATTFTINNTETNAAGVTINSFTDNSLASLIFTGNNSTSIDTFSSASSSAISITNTGSSTANIGTFSDNNATSVTLGAGVTLGQGDTIAHQTAPTGITTMFGLYDTGTAGIAVYGAADNAHVTVNLTAGAATAKTDTIQLGNGNNYVSDASIAGTVNVTVGTGSNYIVLGGSADTTGVYNVTLGAHSAATGIDSITIGSQSVSATPWVPAGANLTVTGAVTGDVITFANDSTALTVATAATTAGTTAALTVAALVSAADATAHQVNYSVFGGNTYVAESSVAGTPVAANSQLTVIELVGTHTFTGATGHVVLAS